MVYPSFSVFSWKGLGTGGGTATLLLRCLPVDWPCYGGWVYTHVYRSSGN